MTIIVCILGGVVGLIVALVARHWAMPYAFRSQEAYVRDGEIDTFGVPAPIFLRDPQRSRQLTIFAYRYLFPVPFVIVFAVAAFEIFNGGSR